jgi:hypothetical protein
MEIASVVGAQPILYVERVFHSSFISGAPVWLTNSWRGTMKNWETPSGV